MSFWIVYEFPTFFFFKQIFPLKPPCLDNSFIRASILQMISHWNPYLSYTMRASNLRIPCFPSKSSVKSEGKPQPQQHLRHEHIAIGRSTTHQQLLRSQGIHIDRKHWKTMVFMRECEWIGWACNEEIDLPTRFRLGGFVDWGDRLSDTFVAQANHHPETKVWPPSCWLYPQIQPLACRFVVRIFHPCFLNVFHVASVQNTQSYSYSLSTLR